jgi:acyl-CoA synthetase (NDP forming)
MAPVSNSAIARLFHPTNVVLVGASDRPGHWSGRVFDNLRRFEFAGRVFPVNPGRADIWGVPCYPTLAALPEAPDHLAIFTPADVTLRVLQDGRAASAHSATVYAAGFGEGGHRDGVRLGAELRKVLDATGLTIVGPSCMGVACGKSGFATIPDETLQPLAPSPVAVVVQSGAMCASINRAINDLGLKVAYLASCGSQIGCKLSDFIDYFAGEPELRVILCYIEAVPDAARFLDAARRARTSGKTVVAVKIGGSDQARASALAHTGSLAGSAEVFAAFASAVGIVRFLSFEDAIEAVEFLARASLPRGGNIAVMSNSGAQSSLIVEAAERTGAQLASLSDTTVSLLRGTLEQADIANPLDTKRTIPTAQYVACLDALVDAPEVDIVLVSEELPFDQGVERRIANLRSLEGVARRAADIGKTVAMFTPLLTGTTEYGRTVRAQLPHVPMLRETERSLRVIRALAEATFRPIHSGDFFSPPADTALARFWRKRAAEFDRPTALNEVESKLLLRAYGIPMPPEHLVQTAAEADAAAGDIGFPVVLKSVTAAVAHKSDAGLVILDVTDSEAVRQAVSTLAERAIALPASLDGILVAKQMSGGTETVLGITRDVEMGPAIMFGMGGVWLELFRDVSFAPASLDRERALAMVRATRAGRLLEGFRGRPPGDIDALCMALVRLAQLARDLGDVVEAVDINPFLVCERGQGGYALDGLVVLRPPAQTSGEIEP